MSTSKVAITADDISRQVELLITEHLRQTGCKKTLDAALTHFTSSARTRAALNASELFSNVAEQNKELQQPYKTVLEFLVEAQLSSAVKELQQEAQETPREWTKEEIASLRKAYKAVPESENKAERWKEISKQVGNGRSRKDCYAKYKELKALKTSRRKSLENDSAHSSRRSSIESINSEANPTSLVKDAEKAKPTEKEKEQEPVTLIVEDFDEDFSIDTSPVNSSEKVALMPTKSAVGSLSSGRPITSDEATQVRTLLFGDAKKCFTKDWTQQGFFFSSGKGLEYGLVQSEGGPCGALAAVQAYILRHLLYGVNPVENWQSPSRADLDRALIAALSHIIWQASNKKQCYVVLQGRPAFERVPGYRNDGITERLHFHPMKSELDVKSCIGSNIELFRDPKGPGLVLVLFSVIFSRGIQAIQQDMDSALGTTPTLVGQHNYCTQELVNLLLTGEGTSNVFDGERNLNEDKSEEEAIMLKGIRKQCPVGFLTLFEAYQYMEVGKFYKKPECPIWVICSESHYSVFFTPHQLESQEFDLYYYDGLARQDEIIKLSVNAPLQVSPAKEKTIPSQSDLIPPLNLVIQTKWADATVDWNSTEPLL